MIKVYGKGTGSNTQKKVANNQPQVKISSPARKSLSWLRRNATNLEPSLKTRMSPKAYDALMALRAAANKRPI